MKKILFFLLLVSTTPIAAQLPPDDFLLMYPWYFEEITIGGVTYNIPNNAELFNATLTFGDTEPYQFHLEVCQTLEGEIKYPASKQMFFPEELSVSGSSCVQNENTEFQDLLFSFFQNHTNEDFTLAFIIIDPGPPSYYLIITNPNGDTVTFNETPNVLSLENNTINKAFLYPNPVKDFLNIESEESLVKVTFYNILGRKLLEVSESFNEISMSDVPKGLLLLEIETEKGTVVGKVLKE
ncbi:MAG: T9SS type A sorting domain-containing protein [Flavobacteriaceae bacterium]